jgi:hypothetical protein
MGVLNEKRCKRRTITKATRTAVWKKWFNCAETGKCWTCLTDINIKRWECGHIIAHAKQGSDDISNLIPQCKGCNNPQRTEDAHEYKKRINSEYLMPL